MRNLLLGIAAVFALTTVAIAEEPAKTDAPKTEKKAKKGKKEKKEKKDDAKPAEAK